MDQSQQVTCAAPISRPVAGGWCPERDQRRLRGVNGQARARTPLWQDVHDPAGVSCCLASDDKVIGQAHQAASTLHAWLNFLCTPCIQHRMEESIGPYGCNDAAWHNPCCGMTQDLVCHDPGAQPLPQKAQYAPVIDPLTPYGAQASPLNAVEGSHTFIPLSITQPPSQRRSGSILKSPTRPTRSLGVVSCCVPLLPNVRRRIMYASPIRSGWSSASHAQ